MMDKISFSTNLIYLLLFPRHKAIFQRQLCLRIVTRFRAIANEQLILYRIIKIACQLECLDVDLEEYS